MAYYSSILTRYKVNDSDANNQSYTASDDNTAAQVAAHTTLAYEANTNDRQINVTGLTTVDLSEDLIAFDKIFKFTATDSKLTGIATSNTDTDNNNGFHGYFANCVFIIDAAISSDSGQLRRPMLGPEAYDWRLQREVDIPTARSGASAWHYYNCKFIITAGGSHETSFVVGDMYDTTEVFANPDAGDRVWFPMGGAITENFYSDASTFDAEAGEFQGYFAQYAKTQGEISGLALQNQYLYPLLNGGSITFPQLSAQQTVLYSASSGGTPANPPLIRLGEFSNTISAALLPSPKVDPRPEGVVWWRNARNLADDAGQCRVIPSRRFNQTAYQDVNQTTGSESIKLTAVTDVSYTTAGNPLTIAKASSNSTYTYLTNSNGTLIGTFNFSNGTVTAANVDHENLDVPVGYLKANEGQTDNDFSTDQIDMSSTLQWESLWGTYRDEITVDSTNWAANQSDADADDGQFIPINEDPIVDLPDPLMAGLEREESNIGTNLTSASGNVSLTDIGQSWKHFIWQNAHYGDWSDSHFSDGVLDVSGSTTRTKVDMNPGQSSATADGTDAVRFDAPVSSNIVTLQTSSSDIVTKLKAGELDCITTSDSIRIDGGTYEANIYGLVEFSSAPGANDYTIKDAELNGTLEFSVAADTTRYIVLENVTVESGGTLSINNGGSGTLEVAIRGAVPSITIAGGTVNLSVEKNITLQLGEDFDSDKLTARFATSSSDTVGTFFDETDAKVSTTADNDADTVLVTLTVASDQSNLWAAIAYDGYDPYVITNTTDTSVSHTLTKNTVNEIDFSLTSFAVDNLDLTGTTVGAITSATDDITVTITDTDGGTIPDNLTRIWLRKYVVESNNYMDAMAQGFVETDFFSFDAGTITLPADQTQDNNRLTVQHTSSSGIYNSQSLLSNRTLTDDLYQSVTTDNVQTYVYFGITTNGISYIQTEILLDALEDRIRGTDDRDLSDVYDKAEDAQESADLAAALSA